MATLPRPVVERIARYVVRPLHRLPLPARRRALEALAHGNLIPGGVAASRQARAGVAGELVAPADGTSAPRVLYLHGGAYEWGSAFVFRNVTASLASGSGQAIFAPDYRLAPEHPAPAALEDVLGVYGAMTDDAEGPVALAGDSAGAGLSLALATAARDRGLPAPAGLALISPWVDLTLSGESIAANAKSDAVLVASDVARSARRYSAVLGPDDPICSPLRADLAGLPPILIQVGGGELFLSESEELARRAEEAGVDVELGVFAGLWHDFHVHTGTLREADEALAAMADWLGARLG